MNSWDNNTHLQLCFPDYLKTDLEHIAGRYWIFQRLFLRATPTHELVLIHLDTILYLNNWVPLRSWGAAINQKHKDLNKKHEMI